MQKTKIKLKQYFNKKNIISFIVVLLVLLCGGLFFLKKGTEIKGNVEDYEIKDTVDGRFIENKRAGLFMKVPEEWEAERVDIGEGLAILFPQETKINLEEGRIVLPLEEGCLIRSTIIYKEADFDKIKKETQIDHVLMDYVIYDDFEEVEVNNYYGLRNDFELEGMGYGVSIYIPTNGKVYGFHLNPSPSEKDRCMEEFNNFLETISIQ